MIVLKKLLKLLKIPNMMKNAIVVYGFEKIIVERDNQSNQKKLRTNRNKSFTINTGMHIPIGFLLAIY